MVALLGTWTGDFGMIRERVSYSSYGVPQASPPGDLDNDSDCDAADVTLWNTLSAGAYDVRADLTLDGVVDTSDYFLIVGAEIQGFSFSRGVLSRGSGLDFSIGNRKGYAGYEHDGVLNTLCHVRNRVLLSDLGRWSRRDPLGYVDGMGLYEYVASEPMMGTDEMGLSRTDPLSSSTGGWRPGEWQKNNASRHLICHSAALPSRWGERTRCDNTNAPCFCFATTVNVPWHRCNATVIGRWEGTASLGRCVCQVDYCMQELCTFAVGACPDVHYINRRQIVYFEAEEWPTSPDPTTPGPGECQRWCDGQTFPSTPPPP